MLTNQYIIFIFAALLFERMDELLSLGMLLHRASVAMSRALNASLIRHGIDLPHSQFTVLRCIYIKGEMSQLDLANILSKDAAAIKRTVDYLESKGLVERMTVRKLKNSVHITDQGRELMPRVMAIAEEVCEKALKNVSATGRGRLMRQLLQISDLLNDNHPEVGIK